MSFNTPVRPGISFKGFRYRSKNNPDGWGIAFYPDKSAQVIKEERKAIESKLSKFLCFVHRKSPYNKIRLIDEDWEINLAEEKRPDQRDGNILSGVNLRATHPKL